MAILPVALSPRINEPVTINGQLEEEVWRLPPAIPFFVRPRVRWIPEAQTQVFAGYDDEALTLAFRCFEDAPERIERNAGPPQADQLFHDDLVGVRLAPEGVKAEARARHFVITAGGRLYEEAPNGSERYVECPQAQCQAAIGQGEWTAEARLGFKEFGMKPPRPGDQWGFAAYRWRVGPRLERSGWIEVGPGPYGETLSGWLRFESLEETEGRRDRAVEPYLRRFGDLLDVRARLAHEAESRLAAGRCPVTRFRVWLIIRSLSSIKNDMLHSFHPDALRHYAHALQFNLGRLDELIETLRQGEDPHTSADGYVFLGSILETDCANHAYAVLLGRGYNSTERHPLFVLLHGLSDDWIAESRSFMPLAWPPELDFVMVFPSGLGLSREYRLGAEDEIFAVLEQVRRRFSVDPRRTILIGFGKGSQAAVRLANRYPHVFSAVAAAGAVQRLEGPLACPLFWWTGPQEGWRGPLKSWDEGAAPGAASAPPLGGPGALIPAILKKLASVSTAPPHRIEILAPTRRFARGAWAQIDRWLDYSRPARLVLETAGRGRVSATAENVGGFTIFPAEGPFAKGQAIRVEMQGREIASGAAEQAPLTVHLTPPPDGPRSKAGGLSGPIDEAFRGPLLYVCGTAGGPRTADLLRQAALQACRWPRHDLRIPVKADAEVDEEDMAGANLHLFGPPAWNSLVARMADGLPARMMENAFAIGAQTYGEPGQMCQFIYPNPLAPGRYVLVHLSNSEAGWLYRGWFPPAAQPEPLPDLWIARLEDNRDITRAGVAPRYLKRIWFDPNWRLPETE